MYEADCADAGPDLAALEGDSPSRNRFNAQLQTVYEVENEADDAVDDDPRKPLLSPRERTSPRPSNKNKWHDAWRIVVETGPTLVLTTVGLLFSGVLLNNISRWKAMEKVNELIIIIPVILNLKGNLELNLSARLGTAANVGELDDPVVRRKVILGNLSLLQVQSTIVSFVAAIMAFVLARFVAPRLVTAGEVNLLLVKKPGGVDEFIITASSAMLATCLSSALLGVFMSTLVVLCRKIGVDPDNIAPPVAACLGDLVPLVLLGVVSTFDIHYMRSPLPLVILLALMASAVGWTLITLRNECVKHFLWQGWLPLFVAMLISCVAGMILDIYVKQYRGFAILAILISGLPGNVGAIVVSRLSTTLHASSDVVKRLPCVSADVFPKALSKPSPAIRTVMLALLGVTIPIEIAFLVTLLAVGWIRVTVPFLFVSLGFFCIAVVASLYLARSLTNLLWKRGLDPDVYALPIHSAIVDLVGLLLLVVCFEVVAHMGMLMKHSVEGLM